MEFIDEETWGNETALLLEEAEKIVREENRGSTSLLQRKLRIGYARAAGLMDLLEEKGVLGSQKGPQPREVLPLKEPT